MRGLIRDKNLLITFGVTLTAIMGVSSVMPDFPVIMREFDVSARAIGLVIAAFTIPGVFVTPMVGILADRLGRKRILVPSLFLFGLAGAACGLSPDFKTLLTFRFFQGMGAAPLGVLYATLIGDLYAGQRRAAAMGLNASVLAIGTAGFPAVGGGLAMLGWRYPFILPLASLPLALAVVLFLDNPEPEKDQDLGEYLKGAARVILTRRAMALLATTLLTFIILYGPFITYFPVLTSGRFSATPLQIGLLVSVASGITAVTASQLGRLSGRFGRRNLLKAACAAYIVSMVLMPFMPKLWMLIFPVCIFGLGQALNIPTLMTLLTGLAPIQQRAAVMSVNGLVLRLGQTVGPVLMALVLAGFGLSAVYFAGAVAALIMLALAMGPVK